jgi:osmotically-inducible protein OsmY
MFKLLFVSMAAVVALGAYNYSNGRDLFHLPGARTLRNTLGETVGDTVRDGVRSAARETSVELKEHASAGVHTAVNRAEGAVSGAALTSKIKAKMALDDLVNAGDINVDTDETVVTLTGTVGSKDEQRRALRIATETAGVTKVVNHLKVR